MRSWRQLSAASARLDAVLRTAIGAKAELIDASSKSPLVTVAIGETLPPRVRDRVLRAAVEAALTEIRRRGV